MPTDPARPTRKSPPPTRARIGVCCYGEGEHKPTCPLLELPASLTPALAVELLIEMAAAYEESDRVPGNGRRWSRAVDKACEAGRRFTAKPPLPREIVLTRREEGAMVRATIEGLGGLTGSTSIAAIGRLVASMAPELGLRIVWPETDAQRPGGPLALCGDGVMTPLTRHPNGSLRTATLEHGGHVLTVTLPADACPEYLGFTCERDDPHRIHRAWCEGFGDVTWTTGPSGEAVPVVGTSEPPARPPGVASL